MILVRILDLMVPMLEFLVTMLELSGSVDSGVGFSVESVDGVTLLVDSTCGSGCMLLVDSTGGGVVLNSGDECKQVESLP